MVQLPLVGQYYSYTVDVASVVIFDQPQKQTFRYNITTKTEKCEQRNGTLLICFLVHLKLILVRPNIALLIFVQMTAYVIYYIPFQKKKKIVFFACLADG